MNDKLYYSHGYRIYYFYLIHWELLNSNRPEKNLT